MTSLGFFLTRNQEISRPVLGCHYSFFGLFCVRNTTSKCVALHHSQVRPFLVYALTRSFLCCLINIATSLTMSQQNFEANSVLFPCERDAAFMCTKNCCKDEFPISKANMHFPTRRRFRNDFDSRVYEFLLTFNHSEGREGISMVNGIFFTCMK